ncbi:MAG: AMP-binding protein [Bacteroidota bacterium]
MMQENLTEFILKTIRNNWSITALTDYKGDSYSYSDVAGHIVHLHARFEVYGIKPGDKVALLGKNSAHWGISYLAVITYGAVVVPILPDFKPNDVHHIVKHSGARLMFAADTLFDGLDPDKMNNGLLGIVSLTDFSVLYEKAEKPLSNHAEEIENVYQRKYPYGVQADTLHLTAIPNSELAVISYTSGTTGFTKGVMLTHNNLTANVVYANNNMPLEPGDAIVSFLPLAHAYGCAFEFLWPFTLGCHITFLTKTPSPQIILDAFRKIKPRLVLAVPLIIEKIYKKRILPEIEKPHIKALLKTPGINKLIHKKIRKKLVDVFGGNFHEIVIGGAPLNPEVEKFLNDIGFPYSIGYGMTECAPLISYANAKNTRLGASGKAVDTLELKIDSDNPYQKPGEIMVRGENVMPGYYNNKEATKNAFDDEGWLRTGDLGLTDKDGYVYIKGRSKSIILGPSGQNIYPEEIEAKLNNKAYVQESLIIERKGILEALVYPDYEATDQMGIREGDLVDILEHYKKDLNKELPSYMNIGRMKIVPEEFEKTPKKSIKRFLYTMDQ